jgi:DNA modification methylase
MARKRKELVIESTTLWDFPTQNYGDTPHGDNKFNGVTPAFVIWNLVQRYTKKGDLVVDPMCGSGTTIDVCSEEKRQVQGFDIAPRRSDIKQSDARHLPLQGSVANLVFVDSPYSDNIKCSDHPDCIGKISCEDLRFFEELEKVAVEARRILKPGGVIAWLIGDQAKNKVYIPVGFKLYQILEKYFRPVDVVAVVRRNQTSNTALWHYRARKFNFFLRGFKYLLIFRKPDLANLRQRKNSGR